jgi:lipid-binding SYLF domain-containing protein
MNRLSTVLALTISICCATSAWAADKYSSTIASFKASPVVAPHFASAYGYALFPNIGKGGIGVGGAHGNGKVYRAGKITGDTSMTQLSIGLQFGGQAYAMIIFFQDKRAYDEFTSGEFEFGAQAAAVAITASAQAQAGTGAATAGASGGSDAGKQKASYQGGMAVFTYAKGGLMYEATLAGQKFNFKPAKG